MSEKKQKMKKKEEEKREASKEKKQKEKKKSPNHKTGAMFSVGLQSASWLKSVKGLKQTYINKISITIKGEVCEYNNNQTKFEKEIKK